MDADYLRPQTKRYFDHYMVLKCLWVVSFGKCFAAPYHTPQPARRRKKSVQLKTSSVSYFAKAKAKEEQKKDGKQKGCKY